MAVVKDKKDVSVLIETHLPEFVTEKHPKFKKFVEKYYEFMESHQLYFGTSFTFDEDKIVDESDGTSYILREDGGGLELESDRDTENDANVQFTIGETLTGNTSQATAVVTGTRGNTIAFIKTTNDASFKYGEKVTGDTTRAYATLANGVVDGTFPQGSIESFRSRAPGVAVRDLKPSQDIDLVNEGLIDVAWKKEFYVNIPKTATTDRRQLLKQMKEVYRAKGNEASFFWLFRALFAKTVGHVPGVLEDIEFYYPKTDLLKLSDGKWVLDKTIKVLTATASNANLFTGKKITGSTSKCTALVEKQVSYFAGSIEVTELTLSNITQGLVSGVLTDFATDETITSETDAAGLYATATTTGIVQNITIAAGGTNYIPGDEIHITAGGGAGARARVTLTSDGVVGGINVIDSGDGYSIGDTLDFINGETGGNGAAGTVKTIIKTGEVLKNTDILQTSVFESFRLVKLNAADYESTFSGHNANTHLFGNSSLIFSALIQPLSITAIAANGSIIAASAYDATKHILAGDKIAKKVSVDTSSKTIKQISKTVTISAGLSEEERRDVIGGKLTYANGNTNIITSFSNNTVLMVRDEHVIGSGETFDIDYASNTYWGTIISANTTKFLYSVGSYYRDSDIDAFTIQNFVNDDDLIIYDSKQTKLGAAAAASGIDAHNMHNGVTFRMGGNPVSVTTSTFTMDNAHGGVADTVHVCNGALNMTSVNVGAIDTFALTSGGVGYKTSPPVSVANSYIPVLGNALDVVGANNSLLNLNLHSYSTGTIVQNGNEVTLDSDGTFPDANSGVLTLTYANGTTDQVTAVTNSSTLSVSSQKIFGPGIGSSPDRETYSISYMAIANNITRNTLLYNDDYSARGRVLDFIDKSSDDLKLSRVGSPTIASGNTTLRVDMTTAKDFGTSLKYYIFIDNTTPGTLFSCVKNGTTTVTTADTSSFVVGMKVSGSGSQSSPQAGIVDGTTIASITNSTTFVLSAAATDSATSILSFMDTSLIADASDDILQEDGSSRIYTETTTGERVTAHSNSVSTSNTGSITQSGTTVTGVGTVFPNDFVRGTLTYANNLTTTITGHTNSTSFTVADIHTIGSGQTYGISYNPVLTWGASRNITVSAGGTGNRTVTVSETGHYLRSGDKVKISGSETLIFNGIFPITVSDDYDNTTYTYTLLEDTAVTSPAGSHKATPVASAWLATSNAFTTDTSIKGKNAVIEVSSVEIGAIKAASIYDFGAGYDSTPILSTTSGDQNAVLTAGIDALATYGGYNTGTTGVLSGVPKIQDNKYYQAFSYVVKADFDVNDYRDSVKRLTHPSGMIMFGEVAVRSSATVTMFNVANNNVDDLGTIVLPGADNSGRKYHNITLIPDPPATINVEFQTFGSNNELEIYTADHPWQAMDASLEVDDDVNLQLELYDEIDSIARINSTMHTVTHTLHGLETGDVIAISGDLTEPQQWQGPHTLTSIPTTNTYTIVPTFDVYDPEYPDAELYDGTLQVQLEDEILGNNVLLDDGVPHYSTSAHKRFSIDNLFSVNVAVANTTDDSNTYTGDIITNHATFGSATKKFTVTGYNPETRSDLNKKALVVGTETTGTFVNTDTLYLHSSSGSNRDVAGGKTINSDLTSVGVYSGNTSPDTFSLIDGINPSFYLKARTKSYANTSRASATNWDDPFSGTFLVEETEAFILMLMEDLTPEANTSGSPALAGQYIVTEDGLRISRDGIAREVFDLKLEKGGSFLYPKLQFPEAETGTVSIDMSFNSDVLLEDDNGAYGWGYLLDETSGTMGNGPQRYISLEEDTEGIEEGHITQSIPYMETTATINLIDSMGYHLITEDGDRILFDDKKYWTVGIEESGDSLVFEDAIGTKAGNRYDTAGTNLGTGNYSIRYEDHVTWEDPHETYSDITTPVNLLLEYNSWTIRQTAPIYQYIDYLTTLGRLLNEDEADGLITQEGNWFNTQAGHFFLEKKDYFLDKNNEVQVEFHLVDSMGSHVITEDYDHFIVEGDETASPLARFVTGEPHVKPSTREIEFTNLYGPQRWSAVEGSENFLYESINDWKDTNIATVSYGMQAFRPHYYSQWASIGLGFVDGKFQMEDNTGIILLEHPVTNQDSLEQEDFPGVLEDIFSTDKGRFDFILLEGQLGTDNGDGKYLEAESGEDIDRILLETSKPGPDLLIDLAKEIKLEDNTLPTLDSGPESGIGYIQLQTGSGEREFEIKLEVGTLPAGEIGVIRLEDGLGNILAAFPGDGLLLSEEDVLVSTTGHLAEQAWTVLPAYQYTRIPTRLSGLINIADEGTTVTGSEYCSFTTELKVGEEFQTEDVTIIAEDSGGDVVLETDERLEHEDITLADVEVFVLDTARDIELRDFRWLISSEDASPMPGQPVLTRHVAAHSSHANVLGIYLERKYPGGDESTAWDTNDESYWIPTIGGTIGGLLHETNDRLGITKVVSGTDDGKVRVESLEWENVNMIWEDMSKQLITEPQAFIVGSITNDSTMTVTREYRGRETPTDGITEAEYRL